MTNKLELLPNNLDAEQGIIGCLLVENNIYDEIQLKPEHFFFPAHEKIYRSIEKFITEGRRASPVTLKNIFENDPDLENYGGAEYLVELANSSIGTFNAKDYAKTVKALFTRRQVIIFSQEVIERARDFDRDADLLSEIEKKLTAVSNDNPASLYSAGEAVSEAMRWISDVRTGKIIPYKTGFTYLDNMLTGFYPGGLYILAGRPGMGKTALMLNLSENIAHHNRALVISLEMRAQELGMRLVSGRTGIPVQAQRQAFDLSQEDWHNITLAQKELSGLNLHIEDASRCNLASIMSIARRHRRKNGSFVLFIDYLGLIGTNSALDKKVYQIEEITNGLKSLAKELSIPVVLLSQLSRGVEGRDNKRPMLSDLRDSGSIEQDADVVLFPFRPEYYHEHDKPQKKANESHEKFTDRMADWEAQKAILKGKAEIIIAKNRNGETGTCPVTFDGQRQRFV